MRGRSGAFAPFKTAVLLLLCLPGVLLAWRYFGGQLGARPVLKLVHGTGTWAIRLVVVALALTPARLLLAWPQSNAVRRMIGVAAAVYAAVHLALYSAQQNFRMLHVASEIVHRFYLAIGFVALAGLVALAATSTDQRMRALGRRWKKLHRAIYGIAALGLLHFFLQAKADVGQAVVLGGLFLWLMGWRLLPATWRGRVAGVAALGVLATLGAGAIELGWYGLTTGIPIRRVLLANFQMVHPRPAAYVAVWSVAALLVVLGRRLWIAVSTRNDRPVGVETAQMTVARKG